jgi:hypothetical protein
VSIDTAPVTATEAVLPTASMVEPFINKEPIDTEAVSP